MGGELRVRASDERTPPPVEGLETDDEEWTVSLEAHRDLLVDVAGVDPTGELTLRELETIRARLEGYVEREQRASAGTGESTVRGDGERTRARTPLGRLLERVLGVVPFVGTRVGSPESSDRRPESQRSYSVTRVRRLARVFRIAIDRRRAEIPSATVDASTDPTAGSASSADAAAD